MADGPVDRGRAAAKIAGLEAALEYVEGDATRPQTRGPAVIVHCCNDAGRWGAGFVLALGDRFPASREAYFDWFRIGSHDAASGPLGLGEVQLVDVGDGIHVANLIGQHGVGRAPDGGPPVRYEAIREGLRKVCGRALALGASVHMPRMGAGLAGGDWGAVERIVEDELVMRGVPVTVYDLPR